MRQLTNPWAQVRRRNHRSGRRGPGRSGSVSFQADFAVTTSLGLPVFLEGPEGRPYRPVLHVTDDESGLTLLDVVVHEC
ncbi:hypothetical protein [Salinarimonas soli]|uniref:Uncharacterized protein n=1 Tax=Salinarimonas soli TaxID=1638099 RepID=A0A5B2VBN9_9HYPH|nr:hypothetical protein [Salinarimonas soli]KAA2235870.1 hypothetical protein F0L46_17670 [Salinarimonas soli]